MAAFLNIASTGNSLIASGNSFITFARQLISGDAMNTFRVSGNNELVTFQLLRNQTTPMTGGVFTQVADDVACELYVHEPYQDKSQGSINQSGAATILQQRVQDFKVTIASGVWNSGYNLSRPILVSEASPVMFEKFAKTKLIYRTRYLL